MNIKQLKGIELKQHTGSLLMVGDVQLSFGLYWHPFVFPKKDFHWEVIIWADSGHKTVTRKRIQTNDERGHLLPDDIYNSIVDDCCDFIYKDLQVCSNCKTKVPQNKIAGHYFAGSYCAHCWETKYKAIEAKETYN